MHNWMCLGSHFQAFPSFSQVWVLQIGNLGPWSILRVQPFAHKLAKTEKKHNGSRKNKETGTRKPRKSAEKNQKRSKRGDDRMTSFKKKKEEAQAYLDMAAREKALKQLGIEDRFEFADHAKIYNADTRR